MDKTIICLLMILLNCCGKHTNEVFNGFKVIAITMGERNYLHIKDNKVLNDKIIQEIMNAEVINGPVKGIVIEITLCNLTDTIKIFSFGGSKYFSYCNKYYEASDVLLPDSTVSKLIH